MLTGGCLGCNPATEKHLDSVTGINAALERAFSQLLINEKTVEACWTQALQLKCESPSYWLLLVRLAEAAVLCAGDYADNCEYEAVGDFLVNPREIVVHSRHDGQSIAKHRHGRLSAQFGLEDIVGRDSTKAFCAGMCLNITKPPLLPYMTNMLRKSDRISMAYLQRLEEGQRRIADTLAFLAGWRIFDSGELWRRLQAASVREREFAESHLCRFDPRVFQRIGGDLLKSLAEPEFRSPFLAGPRVGGNRLKRTSRATAQALASSPV